jgi:squalene synthase HpnC
MTRAAGDTNAQAHAEAIARGHDENFPVAFMLAPRDVRTDMRAIYAYCRITDDIGDAGDATRDERVAMLDAWEDDLLRCWGGAPHDSVLLALQGVVRRRRLDPEPFRALIEANRMDQRISRWQTHDDLIEYCRYSAIPVGRMVLGVLGIDDSRCEHLSDATCAGLQLVNFWQDIRRDLDERDRVYLPAEDMAIFGVTVDDLREHQASPAVRELIRMEVWRARALLIEGAPLRAEVPRRVRPDIAMFTSGGLWVCDAIARQGFDTIARRPAPGKSGRVRMAGAVLVGAVRGVR